MGDEMPLRDEALQYSSDEAWECKLLSERTRHVRRLPRALQWPVRDVQHPTGWHPEPSSGAGASFSLSHTRSSALACSLTFSRMLSFLLP
eukprot:2365663-Rhodomonas_salina.1